MRIPRSLAFAISGLLILQSQRSVAETTAFTAPTQKTVLTTLAVLLSPQFDSSQKTSAPKIVPLANW